MDESRPEALRLVFAFDSLGVHLRSSERLAMRVGRGDSVSGYEGEAGLWCELRDGAGRVLFRRVLADPRLPPEGFSEDPARSVFRADARPETGLCVVLVPADPKGLRVVLLEGASGLRVTARELAGFDLDAVR